MTAEKRTVKKVVAVLFMAALFAGLLINHPVNGWKKMLRYLILNDRAAQENTTISTIESDYTDAVRGQKTLINLNGAMAKTLNMQGLYSSMGMYVTDENYIVSIGKETTGDYEYEELVSFHDFLKENGIHLLYVNQPTKYTDDSLFEEKFGVKTYSNTNMDSFLKRIRKAGIDAVDLRESITEEGLNVSDLFYRTDHHWTIPAGLWAAGIIAENLNKYCGYQIDLSIYDADQYTFTEYKNSWLGEQGRKMAETYTGLDDFTEVKPAFATSFTFKNDDGTTAEGTFDDFVNEKIYTSEADVYDSKSWHYSYLRRNCINNNVENGKVLLLCDSYAHATEAFLALGVHEIDSLLLRSYDDDFDLRSYILENGYDTVIVAYAQFMLGAHDDPSSANYRMFTFDD